MASQHPAEPLHHVVIVGGGFAGLYAAKNLARNRSVAVTLVDRRNFHLFQPLLYQVATGALSRRARSRSRFVRSCGSTATRPSCSARRSASIPTGARS